MGWVALLAGFVGVVVGGVLPAAMSAEMDRRRELSAAAVAARFVSDELELIHDTVEAALRVGKWGAVLDPGLPYARGLWAVEHRGGEREASAWLTHSAELARCISAREWEVVAEPYQKIRRTSLRFWTDVPDRDLDVEARDFLHGVLGCIQPALDALKPLAEGKRRTRLQQLVLGR